VTSSDPSVELSEEINLSTDASAIPRRASRWVRLLVTLAAVGCVIGMGWALTLHQEEPGPTDVAIERLTPPPGSEAVPGQTPVIVDLAYGFNVELTIDEAPVPAEQVIEVESLGQFTFSPGPDKFTERFTNGQHIAQIVYWPKTGDRIKDGSVYQWTFNVV
jgi:hypothetical protein